MIVYGGFYYYYAKSKNLQVISATYEVNGKIISGTTFPKSSRLLECLTAWLYGEPSFSLPIYNLQGGHQKLNSGQMLFSLAQTSLKVYCSYRMKLKIT